MIGVDVLLDSKGQPWILEINASPSLNVDSTIREETQPEDRTVITNNPLKHKLVESKGKYVVSQVDLHVKSMVVGHAVKLCKKSLDKIVDYEEYDSYTQIYSPDIEEQLFPDRDVHD